ncbi:MAG: diaminopimelate epimerase [Alphaproteobacteria bacterium]|nr:diaminopimelate epimerase [Alphaproteobacteria bacterium]MBU0859613.1 diaminopimelate epimerase [Alphaproteobacteria bacterium]
MTISFRKMHGLGNDFVIMHGAAPDAAAIRHICDRRLGIGCDQLLTITPARNAAADIFMHIYNPDGSEAQACGNGTRCVAHMWMRDNGRTACVIETVAGLLKCRMVEGDMVEVDMGVPRLGWQDIPLAEERDTLHLGVMSGPLHDPVAVNVGNPHTVFFVDDVKKVDLAGLGPQVERHVLFPERTNVEFAQIMPGNKIRVRVWERGTGITQACGSGACATIVAAVRRGLTERRAEIMLDGGSLFLEWRADDNHVLMTGPAAYTFEGSFYS